MGSQLSSGVDNDDMIDNLIKSNYIRTPIVEKVFRSVDRAFYFLPEFKHTAYRDFAWKQGNLHISAPCIYSEVLEHLKLEPGHSFLNIGSGTGYLSTLAGLILGPYGTNHGIEIHTDVVEYAYEKLEQFKKTCNGVDVFEFCEPIFIAGNGFNLNHDRLYDRIYCGAACPEAHQEHIKKFMKIGGVLVLPCEDDLLKIERISEESWEVCSVLPVSFSTLQFPDKKNVTMLSMPDPEPLRLQELCRTGIRSLLRSLAENEEPELTQKRKRKYSTGSRKRRTENHLLIPIYEDLSGNDTQTPTNARNGRLNIGRLIFHNYSTATFRMFIRNLARNDEDEEDDEAEEIDGTQQGVDESTVDSETQVRTLVEINKEADASDEVPLTSTDSNVNDSSSESVAKLENKVSAEEAVAVAGSAQMNGGEAQSSSVLDPAELTIGAFANQVGVPRTAKQEVPADAVEATSTSRISSSTGSSTVARTTPSQRSRKFAVKIRKGRHVSKCKARGTQSTSTSTSSECRKPSDDEADEESTTESQPKKVMKREKLDSGISEESDDGKVFGSNESSFSESSCNEPPMPMDVDTDDSDFTEGSSCDEKETEGEASEVKPGPPNDTVSIKYRLSMEKKIKALPLPNSIKLYLNYSREFCVSC